MKIKTGKISTAAQTALRKRLTSESTTKPVQHWFAQVRWNQLRRDDEVAAIRQAALPATEMKFDFDDGRWVEYSSLKTAQDGKSVLEFGPLASEKSAIGMEKRIIEACPYVLDGFHSPLWEITDRNGQKEFRVFAELQDDEPKQQVPPEFEPWIYDSTGSYHAQVGRVLYAAEEVRKAGRGYREVRRQLGNYENGRKGIMRNEIREWWMAVRTLPGHEGATMNDSVKAAQYLWRVTADIDRGSSEFNDGAATEPVQ
jgi:hypothetical protein